MNLDLSVRHGRDLQKGDMFRVDPSEYHGNGTGLVRDDGHIYGIAKSTKPDRDNEIRATLAGPASVQNTYIGVDGIEVVLPNDEVV